MVTIRDIAQATGVSATTVSNVIHGRSHRVSADTIQSINDTIKRLGYVPNMSARSLVSNSSKVIGFINHVVTRQNANFMEDPFHSTAIGLIERILSENGYYLMLRTVKTAEELVAFMQNWNVDGLFFTGIFKDTFFDAVAGLTIPVVLIDSYVRPAHICNVGLEDYEGSYQATCHVIEMGHRHIGFASPHIQGEGVLRERFLGYQAALAKYQIPLRPEYLFWQEMDLASCQAASDEIIRHPDITALIVTADIMAAGIMTGLRSHNKRIPEDISIVGFDDINIAQLVSPPLTTIRQDMAQKAHLAVDYMLEQLGGKKPKDNNVTLPIELIRRQSVKSLL
jgi:LacI family transcriptional regulator